MKSLLASRARVNAAHRRFTAARHLRGERFLSPAERPRGQAQRDARRCAPFILRAMTILVCGSMAYDTIMVFPDQFKKHILPDQIHILNVAFMVPDLRREFGGTAGNIAYNLKLLGEDPRIMATVGHDFAPYERRLEALSLSARYVRRLEDQFTAQAFIKTDVGDNQIT